MNREQPDTRLLPRLRLRYQTEPADVRALLGLPALAVAPSGEGAPFRGGTCHNRCGWPVRGREVYCSELCREQSYARIDAMRAKRRQGRNRQPVRLRAVK